MNEAIYALGQYEGQLTAILFLSLRCGAAMLAAPLFGMMAVPVQLRAFVGVALAIFVANWVSPTMAMTAPDLMSVTGAVSAIQEIVIGLALGFVLQIVFAVPLIAGEQVAGTMGLAIASAVDPASGAQSGALGQFFGLILIFVFLGLGAHLLWLQLVLESYRVMPPGGSGLSPASARDLVGFAGYALATAAAIALPMVLVLLLVQLVMGVLSRSAPSLNLFALGLPAGVLTGLAALIAALPILTEQFAGLSEMAIRQTAQMVMP